MKNLLSSPGRWIASCFLSAVLVLGANTYGNIHGDSFFFPLLVVLMPGYLLIDALPGTFREFVPDGVVEIFFFAFLFCLWALVIRLVLNLNPKRNHPKGAA